jgi:uncharacterized protein (TIGR03083 family)
MGTPVPDVAATFLAQRQRLAERLAGLPAGTWAAPTRCHLWDVADCVSHLIDTNRWLEMAMAVAEDPSLPSPFKGFDNRITPHEQVLAARGRPSGALVDDLVASTERAAKRLAEAVDDAGFPDVRFAFGAFRPVTAGLHLLWDSLLHERDVLLPLGLGVDHAEEELATVSAYIFIYAGVAGGPFESSVTVDVALTDRVARSYRLVTGPAVEVHPASADAGPAASQLTGSTVAVIDALGGRIPLDGAVSVDGPFAERIALVPARLQPPAS